MIYVVSGYRRSGTSVMMAALKASGLPVLSNARLDDFTARHPVIDGYKPTKDLFYEVGRKFYMSPVEMRNFIRRDETAIKIFYDGLPILPAGNYTVIFMQRDPKEIVESLKHVDKYKESFNNHNKLKKMAVHPQKVAPINYPFDVYAEYKPEDVQHCLDIAKARKDIDVIEVQFSDLVENPAKTLNFIRQTPLGRIRVPIDVDKAVAVIDPDWYRCVA